MFSLLNVFAKMHFSFNIAKLLPILLDILTWGELWLLRMCADKTRLLSKFLFSNPNISEFVVGGSANSSSPRTQA